MVIEIIVTSVISILITSIIFWSINSYRTFNRKEDNNREENQREVLDELSNNIESRIDNITRTLIAHESDRDKAFHSINELSGQMDYLPSKVLETITGSANQKKGNLGELIAYMSLQAQYDRIIPLGNIVDFIGIQLPKDGSPGKVSFIDIKTGKKARLSRDQRALKKVIENNNIEFIQYTLDTDVVTKATGIAVDDQEEDNNTESESI